MTDLLVKLFVKDSLNTENMHVRTAYGVLASIVGIICNVLLFGVKLTIGAIINSISIMADAFNNLSDALSSIIGFVGVKLAIRPADKEHPFGHGRSEYIAALIVSLLIIMVGVTLFKNSIQKVLKPEAVGFSWATLIILVISVLVKVWLSLFNRKLGKRINSKVMLATSADARNDVLVTTSTIISVVVSKLTGWTIDGWMGLVVSCFVLLAGINIARDTLLPLLGEAVDKEVFENITKMVESYDGIVGSHDLIAHNYGPSHVMATIHAEVPNDSDLEKIHDVIDQIERDVYKELGIYLVIHMDPVEINDERITFCKTMVLDVISKIDPAVTIHDFRAVVGERSTNLIFDLVVPHAYKDKEKEKIRETVSKNVHERDARYQCVITVETSYIAEQTEE